MAVEPTDEASGLRGGELLLSESPVKSSQESSVDNTNATLTDSLEGLRLSKNSVPDIDLAEFNCAKADCAAALPTLAAWFEHQKSSEHCYCTQCKAFFPNEAGKTTHISDSHVANCFICSLRFGTRSEVDQHRRESGHAYCEDCRALFDTDEAFLAHEQSVHSHSCSCEIRFRSLAELTAHRYEREHRACKACSRLFNTNEALQGHRLAEHLFTCDKCNEQFRGQRSLQAHQRSTLHCYCDMCLIHFETSELDDDHYRQNHFYCDYRSCERWFQTADGFRQHRRATLHLYCNDCEEYFDTDNDDTAHWQEIHTVKCRPCGRIYGDWNALRQHLEDAPAHWQGNKYYCQACGFRYKTVDSLFNHVRDKH